MPLVNLVQGTKENTVTEEWLADYCCKANQHILDVFRPTRDMWDTNWATYNNQFDFSEKSEWQSKNYVPKFKMAVRVAKSLMKKSIIQSGMFFSFEGLNEATRNVENDIEKSLFRVLEQVDFKENQFPQAVFLALLENLMVFKVYPVPLTDSDTPIDEQQEYKIVIKPISAYDFRIDPTGRKKYVIHRVKMDLSDYRLLVKRGVYEKGSLSNIEEDFKRQDEDLKEKIRKGELDIPNPSFRKEVELLEYWGDIDDENGNRLFTNYTFTVVNEKYIARSPIKNPFEHAKPPFVWGPLFEKAGSVYHEGFGDGAIGLARAVNEALNLWIDSVTAESIKAYEVNLDLVHQPGDLKSGIYPGKIIKSRGGTPGQKAITDFTLGSTSQNLPIMYANLDREFQNATGINEFIAAVSGVGDKTATEVKTKTAQSMSLMQSIAEEIEDNVLQPLLEMSYSLVLQYNPELLGERVNLLPKSDLRFRFKARGMSKIVSQIDELQKMFMWINMVGQTPIGQTINWQKIGEMSARYINQDPNELLVQSDPRNIGEGTTNQEQNALELIRNSGGKDAANL